MFRLWREADSSELCRFAAWAFGTQPLLSRDAFAPDAWGDCDTWFERTAAKNDLDAAGAPLVLAWYQRSSWSDAELAEKLRNSDPSYRPTAREMLATLGEAGRRVLEKWDAENAQLYCPNGVPMARSTSTKRNFSSSGIYFAFDECPDCRRSAVASPGDGYARCYKERKARELVLCPVKKLGFR